MMVGFLYYGRLEKEKWMDSLIEAIKILKKEKISCEFFIFGSWSLEKEILELVSDKVHFFGRKPLSFIEKYLSNISYCLMPSEFLETFGLSALNALSWWIPVVGYKKWGMQNFVFWDCNLYTVRWKNTKERLISFIRMVCTFSEKELAEKKEAYQYQSLLLVDEFSKTQWYQHFLKLSKFPDGKGKILLVSDFINKVWGIETYLYDVKEFLEQQGFEVILRWKHNSSWFFGKIQRYLGILLAPFAFITKYQFKKLLEKEQPDLIRFNSLLRRLWKGVVQEAKKYQKKRNKSVPLWMMYHDFGYFYPYPHRLYEVEQCRCPFSLRNFISQQKWIKRFFALIKYFLLKSLIKELTKSISLHLVPSEFMREIVRDSYQLSETKIKAFPHGIQG